jgi:hypothetical protein
MEAAALYAFSENARRKPALCFAHVTNQMALIEGYAISSPSGRKLNARRFDRIISNVKSARP